MAQANIRRVLKEKNKKCGQGYPPGDVPDPSGSSFSDPSWAIISEQKIERRRGGGRVVQKALVVERGLFQVFGLRLS